MTATGSLVSTGGGAGHAVGCVCPFCTSKVGPHSEQSGGTSLLTADEPPTRAYADAPEVFLADYDDTEAKVAAFGKELEGAFDALATDENWLNYLDTMRRFHKYSATNQLLIALQTGGRATRCASFNDWKKFGRNVKKGEKGLAIFAPITGYGIRKDANGNPILDENGKPQRYTYSRGFKVVSTFDIAQTEGEPLPELEQELSADPPSGFVDDMVASAERAGYTVQFVESNSFANGTAQGSTNPATKVITVDASLSPGSQAATLAHELGHVYAGHCDPENNGKYHTGAGGCRGQFEVEAESIAYALCRSNGMEAGDTTKLTAQYVRGWSGGDKEALKKSANTVANALKGIMYAEAEEEFVKRPPKGTRGEKLAAWKANPKNRGKRKVKVQTFSNAARLSAERHIGDTQTGVAEDDD